MALGELLRMDRTERNEHTTGHTILGTQGCAEDSRPRECHASRVLGSLPCGTCFPAGAASQIGDIGHAFRYSPEGLAARWKGGRLSAVELEERFTGQNCRQSSVSCLRAGGHFNCRAAWPQQGSRDQPVVPETHTAMPACSAAPHRERPRRCPAALPTHI